MNILKENEYACHFEHSISEGLGQIKSLKVILMQSTVGNYLFIFLVILLMFCWSVLYFSEPSLKRNFHNTIISAEISDCIIKKVLLVFKA